MTDEKNISYENNLSISKQRVCSDKGPLKKPERAVITTCHESENSRNIKTQNLLMKIFKNLLQENCQKKRLVKLK